MPKRVAAEAKRVPLNCLISPATRLTLAKMGGSQGSAVDRAAEAWLKLQDVQQSRRYSFKEIAVAEASSHGPTAPQKYKRGPREKGDKTR